VRDEAQDGIRVKRALEGDWSEGVDGVRLILFPEDGE